MNRLPAASTATASGWLSWAEVAGPPSPPNPGIILEPATVLIMDVGAGSIAFTVNVWALVVPPEVVTVTLRGPAMAVESMVKVAVAVVEPETDTLPTVICGPAETLIPDTKLVPVMVTFTAD